VTGSNIYIAIGKMLEKKKSSGSQGSSSNASSGNSKKKARPPPLEVSDATANAAQGLPTFSLPTVRNMYNFPPPNQQIVVTPAAQLWDIQEQAQLERLHRSICFPNESLLNKSIKIAGLLNHKTIRDVASRVKLMEEAAQMAPPVNRSPDEVDRLLTKSDAILAELQAIPARERTDEQNVRMNNLVKDFVATSKTCKTSLESKGSKIPIQLLQTPELPAELLSKVAKPNSGSGSAKSEKAT